MVSDGRKCRLALLLICIVVAASMRGVGAKKGTKLVLSPILDLANAEEWDEGVARALTTPDVNGLLGSFDNKWPGLMKTMKEYQQTRLKDSGIRLLANWGNALAHLYEIDTEVNKRRIYKRMAGLADLLLTAQETTESYVEGRVMRGWPMYVDPKDRKQTYGEDICFSQHAFQKTLKQMTLILSMVSDVGRLVSCMLTL